MEHGERVEVLDDYEQVRRPTSVGVYGRISGSNQATIPDQIQMCRRKADDLDIPVRYILHDDGIVARNLDRPQFQQLMGHAGEGRIDAIIVWKLDRLVRSLTDLLNVHRWLEARGVALISVTEPFDTTTAFGRFSFRGIASAAELESELIAERVRLGRARQEAAGKWIGWQTPLGYKRDEDGRLAINAQEKQVVWTIFNRYARGMAITELSRRLEEEGIRSRRETPFSPGSLHFILNNRIYIGREKIRDTTRIRPELRIVSKHLWNSVQSRKGKRVNAPNTPTRRQIAIDNVYDAYQAFQLESNHGEIFSEWLLGRSRALMNLGS